ncbi:MAG: restriction endonuclease subunit S, partial [Bacteroidales bacterium]|nr:restriction endonuclease subunit S [Bacteroidales bacterium]
MSEWKKVKFLDVVHLNPRISLEKGVEYPFVEMSNVVPCARKPEKDVFKKYLGEGTKFEQGDTIVARIEPCLQNGKGFQCSYKQGFGSTEFLVFRPMNINDLDCDFLYYYMGQQSIREAMAKTMVGASGRQRVNNKVFNDLQINLPPLSTQHRIASILSRYDSLIENYQKQIKLLEEAAQRLYKEWFIDLRFPGHENTKIVDGLPEGWTPSQLGQLVEFKRGKTITKKDVIDGDIPVVAGGLEPAYYCNKSNTAERVITVSGSGANAGFTRMYFEKVWASDCSFVDASTTPFLHYVYCFLKDNKTTIDNLQKGAAQPHVYAKDINSLGLCIPIESILKSFEGKISKYFDSISSLQSQIRLLTEARDRLLPKLMNGEI